MKAIKNIETLVERLSLIDKDWQKIIYDKTGAILLESLNLVSNCGYISLDADSEYSYSSAIDTTEYCEINSIDEVISYIKEMESYSALLVDQSFGKFTKSDLFWGIYERILLQNDNMDESEQYWGLYSIGQYNGNIELHMALIPCSPADIWLNITVDTSLDEALEMLVAELNVEVEYQEWLPMQKVFSTDYSVPKTYDEIKGKCSPGSFFGWLQ